MSKNESISALILAGGQGTRMNKLDKGLVTLEGKKLIEYVIERLGNQVSDIHISCNRNQDIYQSFGFSIIDDTPFPSEGPLCGIAAGLQRISCDKLLIVPCDAPLLPLDLLKLLNDALDVQNEVACISNHGSIQPLFSLFDKRLSSDLARDINKGERKTQNWIKSRKYILVDDERTELYTNLNSLDELSSLKLP